MSIIMRNPKVPKCLLIESLEILEINLFFLNIFILYVFIFNDIFLTSFQLFVIAALCDTLIAAFFFFKLETKIKILKIIKPEVKKKCLLRSPK